MCITSQKYKKQFFIGIMRATTVFIVEMGQWKGVRERIIQQLKDSKAGGLLAHHYSVFQDIVRNK